MAKTRVHEIAKEYDVPAEQVVHRLRLMGEFVKSASSVVEPRPLMALKHAVRTAVAAGATPQQWFAAESDEDSPPANPFSAGPRSSERSAQRPSPRVRRHERVTSWTGSALGPEGERVWRHAGLGDDHEPLARFLLEHGVLPSDLKVRIRGTAAVHRLRSGEASWHVLVRELKEVRDALEQRTRPLPDTRVVRRRKDV